MVNDFGFNFDNTYTMLPKTFFSFLEPTQIPKPKIVLINNELAKQLELNIEALTSKKGANILAGSDIAPKGVALAQAYAGHQFGHFTILGDGRALLLGEQVTSTGERYDLQLKGSGLTPYSRGGDGKATLGPMLREYIISEAMHALKIPTTRSLAVVTTGEWIYRETLLPGAILTRVAQSHLRVGTFQYAVAKGNKQDLKMLADYAINRHYPELSKECNKYLSFFKAVVKNQASLISKWMLVGFIHGVMNTDNMTISGETIDYGPCAFMDTFDPSTVFSSIDHHGRYAYANQPKIAVWNLARFAETLLPLLDDDLEKAKKMAEDVLKGFFSEYNNFFLTGMANKLGLVELKDGDQILIKDLLRLMNEHKADYTNTFVAFTYDQLAKNPLCQTKDFKAWKIRWDKRIEKNPEGKHQGLKLMKKTNPIIIPRNHKVEEALRAVLQRQDYEPLHNLLKALENPFSSNEEQNEYAKPPDPAETPYKTFCGT